MPPKGAVPRPVGGQGPVPPPCVENTFDGTLLQDHEGNFKTRKAGTSLHGMGLDSVRRALSSLDGFLQVRIEGRRFIAEAIWYLPEHPQTTDITS